MAVGQSVCTGEAVCSAGAVDCEEEDIQWAAKKIIKECGEEGGSADLICTSTSVEIDGEIECNEA